MWKWVYNRDSKQMQHHFSPFSLKNMIKIAEKFAQFKKTSYLCTRQKEMTQTTRLKRSLIVVSGLKRRDGRVVDCGGLENR